MRIAKMDAQSILESNGNRNGVINRRCEWTIKVKNPDILVKSRKNLFANK